jgi:hypothetical protein
MKKYYSWLYGIAVVFAVITAFAPVLAPRTTTTLLAIFGVLIGIIGISLKEANDFLTASVALIVAGLASKGLENVAVIGTYVPSILYNVISLVAPAAIIVAIKELNKAAR